jgi:hypothetical protein
MRVAGAWKYASDLQVGDVIDGGRETWGEQREYVALPWPAESRITRHVEKFDTRAFWSATNGPHVVIDEMWGRLLGIIVGDGGIGGTGGVCISLDAQDEDLAKLLMSDFKSIGLSPTYRRNVGPDRVPAGGASISVTSASFTRFLELVGVAKRQKGVHHTYEKVLEIPEVIWRSPRSVAVAFLSGLFEADGSGVACVSLCTKSETLARSVQRLFTALGIISTVRKRDTKLSYTKKDGSRDYTSWVVIVLTRELDIIRSEIMISSRKRSRVVASVERRERGGSHGHGKIESLNDEIVSISTCWLQPIDVQVDGEVFLVNGLVSHNSWLKVAELAACGVPVVASPRVEYSRLRKLGVGWLARNPSEWRAKLRILTSSEAERVELAQRGRAVMQNWTIEGNAWRWWETWTDALKLQRESSAASPLVRRVTA